MKDGLRISELLPRIREGIQRIWNASSRFDVVPVFGKRHLRIVDSHLSRQNSVRGTAGVDSRLLPTSYTNLIMLRDITLATNPAFIDETVDSLLSSATIVETLILIKANREGWTSDVRLCVFIGLVLESHIGWTVSTVLMTLHGRFPSE